MTDIQDRSNADFSDVGGGGDSGAAPDFSDVQGGGSSTAPAAGRTYTVKSGDTLRKIAQRFYGDEMQWHKIRNANREKLPNPDLIQVGMTLTIPEP